MSKMNAPKYKPSLRDRDRATWAKQWKAHKEKIRAQQKEWLKIHYKKVVAPRLAGLLPAAHVARVIFAGVVEVLELACIICGMGFTIVKSKSNHRPKYCPVCQTSIRYFQRREWDEKNGRGPKKSKAA